MSDRFGAPPAPVANLLALVRLKTEAARLGFESIALRDAEMLFKLRRTVSVDRVGLVKRYRSEAHIQLGEVRLPRRRFSAEPAPWLAELRELLPVIVGHKDARAALASASAR